ncbi:AGC protein kinase [Saprolegnia parasitica CBS 223.65]|uniref:AGC protein kinase n=1 Tax=Saprolegnia parasitica (strain CBS 223.65) TaxID=695850 RepID=A0A067C9N1_SAPPC|nr:AGC protein kinase [Saprolegnia parasitica CBS 223.65]KDO23532.1 AGC protein kinase [Saprolegnia parasitica CBS 223.65]|eukprot:XP_012205684.1 AGC protein kinase [Saprolegnia parasitica CBS 223.65]
MTWSVLDVVTARIPTWNSQLENQTARGGGQRFTSFQITVQGRSASWSLAKRYSQFRDLHLGLCKRYASVRSLPFPPKRFFSSLSLRVIEQRRLGLEGYVQSLLAMRPRPHELTPFLAPDADDNSMNDPAGRTPTSEIGSTFTTQHAALDVVTPPIDLYLDTSFDPSRKWSVADFDILKVLGKGSFGKVYLVRTRDDKNTLYAMKVLKKTELIQRHQVDHTMTEREVMSALKHPFIVALRCSFQTESTLFMVSDYCCGGEIFFHLKKFRAFSESMVRFYAAELISALGYLHSKNIVYRDLKPENVLLDADGHLRLTDFGLSKKQVTSTSGARTFCGTPEYLAPEMLLSRKHKSMYGSAIDWWSLGTLLYEMLTGWPPYFDRDVQKMCENILIAPLAFPARFGISSAAKSLIRGLLERDPTKRLQAPALKAHPFFQGLDWKALEEKRLKPPFKPRLQSPTDLQNFDKEFTKDAVPNLVNEETSSTSVEDEFYGFSFTYHHQASPMLTESDMLRLRRNHSIV